MEPKTTYMTSPEIVVISAEWCDDFIFVRPLSGPVSPAPTFSDVGGHVRIDEKGCLASGDEEILIQVTPEDGV